MAYNEQTAERLRQLMRRRKGFAEKKMFGGLGFLLHGNMCVGVWKEFLILRVGKDRYQQALAEPFVREFDITGRPMAGWVMLEPAGIGDDRELKEWVDQAVRFVAGLPVKAD